MQLAPPRSPDADFRYGAIASYWSSADITHQIPYPPKLPRR
jgi:hypothetical protein